jgi:hypothetical protein
MYIPTTFYGTQGACITATITKTAGTGSVTSGSFFSASVVWNYIQFENTVDPNNVSSSFEATLNILSGSTGQAKLLVVAGGGAGGYGACVLAPSSCNSTAAGGGGGGGVVYYDNFPIASGSYTISVGAGGGDNGAPGRQGANTTFTNNIPYTPFTSSVITAYGGGRGGYIINNGYGSSYTYVAGVSGGSAGGTVVCDNGNGAGQIIQACCDGLGGLNGANQGNDASGGIQPPDTFNYQGTGGGGAGTPGAQTSGYGPYVSNGGDGLPFNLTGTTLYYAAGGGGVRGQGFPVAQSKGSNGNGSSGFGNGGQGKTLSYVQGTTATNGVVTIAWPVCSAFYNGFKLYNIANQNPQTLFKFTNTIGVSNTIRFNTWGNNMSILAQTGSLCMLEGSASVNTCNARDVSNIDGGCAIYTIGGDNNTYTYVPCGGTASVSVTYSNAGDICAVRNSVTGSTVTYISECYSTSCGTGSIYLSGSIVTNGLTLWNAFNSYSNNTNIWYDASGNNNNGVVSASAASTIPLANNYYGIAFNSTATCLLYANTTASLAASPSSSYTIQAYYPKFVINGSLYYSQELIGTGNTALWFYGPMTNFNLGGNLQYRSTFSSSVNMAIPSGSTVSNMAKGGLITVTVDQPTKEVKMYYNNTLVTSGSVNYLKDFGSGSIGGITFGRRIVGDIGNNGKSGMSNIALYNRILTAGEINQNFNYFSQSYAVVTGSCP